MIEIGKTVVIHIAKYLDGNDRLCHHNCKFCMERMEPGCSNKLLPSIQEIDNALSNYLTKQSKISKIYIAGGEPTLRDDFKEVVDTVKKYCNNIVLSTCCDFSNQDEMVEIITQLGIKYVATSVHSHLRDVHDKLTESVGSFDRTISSIKKLIDADINVTINAVINSYNVESVSDIVEFFQSNKLKIKKLTLTHYMNHGNAYYHNELKFDIDKYSAYISDAVNRICNVDYDVTFRDFPICIDVHLERYIEDVENIDIINLNTKYLNVMSEKAPAFAKRKCYHCKWYNKCPRYLRANYGE